MGALQKILIVDDGRRRGDRSLAAELAEMGYASVTASLEASDEVLAMLGEPVAIVLDMSLADPAGRIAFEALAERLRGPNGRTAPVIEVDGSRAGSAFGPGGWMGSRTLNAPEL